MLLNSEDFSNLPRELGGQADALKVGESLDEWMGH
jgi:hypothetical protein